jgi:hypothetical protein
MVTRQEDWSNVNKERLDLMEYARQFERSELADLVTQ